MINHIRTAATNAITPPSFLGIDRRIAYAKRKYHSGWIWVGVTKGLAGIKFSGSFRAVGAKRARVRIPAIKSINPAISLVEKYAWKGVLSILLLSPVGLLDPVWWRNRRCITDKAAIMKGKRK